MKIENIKFKAKRLDNGEWVIGDLMKESYGVRIIEHTSKASNWIAVDPNTVCQFTGFKDKKGKEVYEDDVLRSDNYPFSCIEDNAYDNYYGIVGWSEFSAAFYVKTFVNPKAHVSGISHGDFYFMSHYNFQDFEVVGNIHDEEWQKKLKLESE